MAVEDLTPSEAASSLGLTPEALRERLAIEMAEEAAPPQAKAG